MKKVTILALTLALTLGFQSCKEKTEGEPAETPEVVETPVVAETPETPATGAPTFADADVQAYVDSYESYIAEYKKVVESKDMAAFAGLSTKGQELATKSQAAMTKLKGEDLEKFTTYMTAKSTEMQELAAKMAQ